MDYEINSNTYTTTQCVEVHDTFNRENRPILAGVDIDSVLASWIIVKEIERPLFKSLTQQEGIDKKIELGYIILKI